MKAPAPLSRRGILTFSAAAAAMPPVGWRARQRLPLFTQSRGVSGPFLASMVKALEDTFTAAGRPVEIQPRISDCSAEVERLTADLPPSALVFAGGGWDTLYRRALGDHPGVLFLDLGTDLEPDHRRVSGPLAELVAAGAADAVPRLGTRAGVLCSGTLAATDLPLVLRHAVENAGGSIHDTVVLHGQGDDPWARLGAPDFVMVLAAAADAANLWRSRPPGLPVITHVGSGAAPDDVEVVHPSRPLLEVLAARTVARVLGQPRPELHLELHSAAGHRPLTPAAPSLPPLAARNRSAIPFTSQS